MKLIYFIFLLLNTSLAFAGECEVYGISDSPQSAGCAFKHLDLKLSCQDGHYFLNRSKVSVAYHLEVEDGPVPLVFKATDMQLTLTIYSKSHIKGELEQSEKSFFGRCKLK